MLRKLDKKKGLLTKIEFFKNLYEEFMAEIIQLNRWQNNFFFINFANIKKVEVEN